MKLSGSNIKKFFVLFSKEIFFIICETQTGKKSFYFRKQNFVIFLKMKTPTKFFIFQEIEFSYISGNGTSYIFLKKVFLVFQGRYIQTSGTFSTRSIFRTLACLELPSFS